MKQDGQESQKEDRQETIRHAGWIVGGKEVAMWIRYTVRGKEATHDISMRVIGVSVECRRQGR